MKHFVPGEARESSGIWNFQYSVIKTASLISFMTVNLKPYQQIPFKMHWSTSAMAEHILYHYYTFWPATHQKNIIILTPLTDLDLSSEFLAC